MSRRCAASARTSRADALVLAVTFIATLTIRLEFAILVGVLVSLLVYLNRTTHPQVLRVVPDPARRSGGFAPRVAIRRCARSSTSCAIDGSLFFGAVEHVRDELEAARGRGRATRHVLLVGSGRQLHRRRGRRLLA